MIEGGRVLGLIPARGGSKGVPRKNIRPLGGKPLLQWTVEAAQASRYIDRLVLSTDDAEIAELGGRLGVEVPFRRPREASSDTATATDVIVHALGVLDEPFDFLVYLEPTTPLRLPADIDRCLELLTEKGAPSCVSVQRAPHPPDWLFYLTASGALEPVLSGTRASRRQDLKEAFLINGAVYAARVDGFLRIGTFITEGTVGLLMPKERSIDLDEIADFEAAEALLRARRASIGD